MSIIRREQLTTPLSASYAATASVAVSSSYALTASFAENANATVDTGSLLTTASVSLNTITFTKGDGSTFPIIVNTGSVDVSGLVTTSSFNAYTASINSFTSSINIFTASYNTGSFSGSFTGSLLGTSSWAVSASQAISSSYYKETDPIFTAVSGTFVTTSSFNAFTSSINSFTSSYNTGSFSGSFTGSLQGTSSWAVNSINSQTASFLPVGTYQITSSWAQNALTASHINSPLNQNLTIVGNQTITGSLTVTNNLTVLGTTSIQYISESTLNIGTNLITVNTFNPSIRFGGLAVIDSGSSPLTSASFLYDSVQDEFIFVHRGNGVNITSSHFVLGPETYDDLGNEIYLTTNRIPKSVGNEHLNDSNISDNGTLVNINSNTNITGSTLISGSLTVTNNITASLVGTASWANNSISSSFANTSIIANTASYIDPTFISSSAAASGFVGSNITESLLVTASVLSNVITFTKGDGSTFPIVVNTGSGTTITIQNQDSSLGTATVFNFTGSGITASLVSSTASIRVNSSYDWPLLSITETASRLENWSPTNWPGVNDVIKVININPNNTNNIISISGLSSGSVGRIITLHNSSSNNLLIIEHLSVSSSLGNRFALMNNTSYFLMPGRDITFLYNGTDWSQLTSNGNFGGFDYVDDMVNGTQAINATNISSQLFNWISGNSGAVGSLNARAGEFGVISFNSSTTNNSFFRAAAGSRTTDGSFVINTTTFPLLYVGKVRFPTANSVAQDYDAHFGLINSTTTSTTTGGQWWYMPTSASGVNTWQIANINTTVTSTNIVTTTVPKTTEWLYLGLFYTGVNSDCVYFHSLNGINYTVSSKFNSSLTGSGNFGGKPFFGMAKTAGTTSRTMEVDWAGISMNILNK